MLTTEQRQLLGVYPASMISDTVCDPDAGISRIKSGQCGGSRLDGPVRWFSTESKGIKAGAFGEPTQAFVTWTQLRNWALSVPADLREKIRQVRDAERAENARTYKWCGCGQQERCEKSNKGDPFWGGRYHYSEEEYEQHLEVVWDLRDQERALLDQALGLGDDPVGQLDLFEELMEGTA